MGFGTLIKVATKVAGQGSRVVRKSPARVNRPVAPLTKTAINKIERKHRTAVSKSELNNINNARQKVNNRGKVLVQNRVYLKRNGSVDKPKPIKSKTPIRIKIPRPKNTTPKNERSLKYQSRIVPVIANTKGKIISTHAKQFGNDVAYGSWLVAENVYPNVAPMAKSGALLGGAFLASDVIMSNTLPDRSETTPLGFTAPINIGGFKAGSIIGGVSDLGFGTNYVGYRTPSKRTTFDVFGPFELEAKGKVSKSKTFDENGNLVGEASSYVPNSIINPINNPIDYSLFGGNVQFKKRDKNLFEDFFS